MVTGTITIKTKNYKMEQAMYPNPDFDEIVTTPELARRAYLSMSEIFNMKGFLPRVLLTSKRSETIHHVLEEDWEHFSAYQELLKMSKQKPRLRIFRVSLIQ